MKIALTLLIFIFSTEMFAKSHDGVVKGHNKQHLSADSLSACAEDIQRAGCADKDESGMLMRCLHAYKKANQGFQLSESCKAGSVYLVSAKKDKKDDKSEKKTK